MAYVDPDYPTKKLFRAAVAAGTKHQPYNPSGMFPVQYNGHITVEGPHYPKPHQWYARCRIVEGVIVSVT